MKARNEVIQGYHWILGDGMSFKCTRDPWLASKDGFRVDQSRLYVDNNMVVAHLFRPNVRASDTSKVTELFSDTDAVLILSTHIPSTPTGDRLAWSRTSNSKYLVKMGYQLWHSRNVGTGSVTQSTVWNKLWNLDLLHKVKLLLWHFCRNNVPVRSRLSKKGIHLPLNYPMCNLYGIELWYISGE